MTASYYYDHYNNYEINQNWYHYTYICIYIYVHICITSIHFPNSSAGNHVHWPSWVTSVDPDLSLQDLTKTNLSGQVCSGC